MSMLRYTRGRLPEIQGQGKRWGGTYQRQDEGVPVTVVRPLKGGSKEGLVRAILGLMWKGQTLIDLGAGGEDGYIHMWDKWELGRVQKDLEGSFVDPTLPQIG